MSTGDNPLIRKTCGTYAGPPSVIVLVFVCFLFFERRSVFDEMEFQEEIIRETDDKHEVKERWQRRGI